MVCVMCVLSFLLLLCVLACMTFVLSYSVPCARVRVEPCVGSGSNVLFSAPQTGRFGIGFNSVYHVTDVPSFVSRDRICFFDPHADYLPAVSASNPGKMLHLTAPKVQQTIAAHPHQFAPYFLPGKATESLLVFQRTK